MWPVIAPGDGVVARRIDRRPRRGEIVVLRTRIGIVTHRLVGWVGDPPQLVASGDWLDAEDAPLPESALLGVVFRIVKRRVTLDLHSPLGLLAHGLLFCGARLLNGPRRRRLVRRLRATFRPRTPNRSVF